MKAKPYLNLISPLLILLGCSQARVLIKIPTDECKTLNLAVVPFVAVTVNCQGADEMRIGNNNKDSMIINYMQTNIVKGLQNKSIFNNVLLCRFQRSLEFIEDSIQNEKEIIKTTRPVIDSGSITCNNDLVLAMYNVFIDSVTIENHYQDVYVSTTSLRFNCEFVYWDTKSKNVMSYGKISKEKTNAYPMITIKNWNTLAENVVDALLGDKNHSGKIQRK